MSTLPGSDQRFSIARSRCSRCRRTPRCGDPPERSRRTGRRPRAPPSVTSSSSRCCGSIGVAFARERPKNVGVELVQPVEKAAAPRVRRSGSARDRAEEGVDAPTVRGDLPDRVPAVGQQVPERRDIRGARESARQSETAIASDSARVRAAPRKTGSSSASPPPRFHATASIVG